MRIRSHARMHTGQSSARQHSTSSSGHATSSSSSGHATSSSSSGHATSSSSSGHANEAGKTAATTATTATATAHAVPDSQGQPASHEIADRSQISGEAREADHADGAPGADGEKGTEKAEKGNLFDGLKDWMAGGLQKVMPGLPLDDAEKKQVSEATETLKKLAGEDGRWDGRDLRNNLAQMQDSLRQRVDERIQQEFDQRTQGATRIGTNLRRRIGERVLEKNYGQYVGQGMGIARQTAMDGMVGGQDKAGVKRPQDYNAQAQPWSASLKPVTTEEMERFGSTMKMIEDKSQAAGYPRQSYANGIPVKLLETIRDGKLPVGVR